MKNTDILRQAGDILGQTTAMVEHAHRLLRNDEISQVQFLDLKKLEMKVQKLYRKLKDESR
jgi:hypothetical protein